MKVNEALNTIISTFEKGDLPAAIACTTFPMHDVPMNKWSFFNKLIAVLAGTEDARGFRQWEEVGRHVVKGSHAFYILAPKFQKIKDNEKEEDEVILSGFLAVPVFRVEDTDGEPLTYQQLQLPPLNLMEVAEAFGLKVSAIPGNGRYYGYYCHDRKEIALATDDESTFFHELAHAADYRVRSLKPGGQTVEKEIVAELSAASLAYMIGKTMPSTIGNHFQYIKRYAEDAKMNVVSACMKYFVEVEAVLKEIIKYSNTLELGETGETKHDQFVHIA